MSRLTPPALTDGGFGGLIDRRVEEDVDLGQLLHERGLLVLRGLAMDDAACLALACRLAAPEPVHPVEHRVPGQEFVRLQSNIEGLGVAGGGTYWHADGPWHPDPAGATVLRAVEVPSEGGDTRFADMRRAWASLPETERADLADLRAAYPCRAIYARELEALGLQDPSRMATLQDLEHPLVRVHPVTGVPALYLNQQWLAHVVGLDPDDSQKLLARLYDVAVRPDNVYVHRWQHGDVLVWDNALVMHRGDPVVGGRRKVTHRITTAAFSSVGPRATAV